MLNNFVNVFHFKIVIFIDAGQRNDFLVPWFNYWVSDDYTSTKVSCCWWTPTSGKYVAWNLFKGTQLSELNFFFMLKVANIRCFKEYVHKIIYHFLTVPPPHCIGNPLPFPPIYSIYKVSSACASVLLAETYYVLFNLNMLLDFRRKRSKLYYM
jgi:hypothetical protein